MEQWREEQSQEWMEQFILEAERDVPVPMPANLKEQVMRSVCRKQKLSEKRKILCYNFRICAAACMALVVLAGTAFGMQKSTYQPRQEIVWMQKVQTSMNRITQELNLRINEVVTENYVDKGGKRR